MKFSNFLGFSLLALASTTTASFIPVVSLSERDVEAGDDGVCSGQKSAVMCCDSDLKGIMAMNCLKGLPPFLPQPGPED